MSRFHIQKLAYEFVMFMMVFSALMMLSKTLPSAMAELDDCYRHCYEQKRQCHEGLEDPWGSRNKCEQELFSGKMSCEHPKEGYRPVHGVQLEFKIKPVIKDLARLIKKNL